MCGEEVTQDLLGVGEKLASESGSLLRVMSAFLAERRAQSCKLEMMFQDQL